MSQTKSRKNRIKEQLNIPDEINSSTAKLVYMYLKSVTSATVDEMSSALKIKQITILPILSCLQSNKFIMKSNNEYKIIN